ncbi:MAG TPA: hypothetical protein VGW12_03860 [Pyrinomonadaceae bacterium]|nr:hypothetical protein [Pyrinomonadaceae bacterium]
MTTRTLATLVWLSLSCILCAAQGQLRLDESLARTVKSVEPQVGNLKAPVKVCGVETYRDGGNIAALLQDDAGKFFLFALEKLYDRQLGDSATGSVYVGVAHPSESAGPVTASSGCWAPVVTRRRHF